MKKVYSLLIKYAVSLSAIATLMAATSMASACYITYHQPAVPAAMDKFRM